MTDINIQPKVSFLILAFVTILFSACGIDEIVTPSKSNFSQLVSYEIDANRLCIAEVISNILVNDEIKDFIYNTSNTGTEYLYKEIFLIEILADEFENKNLFFDAITTVIETKSSCYNSIEEFIEHVTTDPALVIKIPDVLPLSAYIETELIPFVYANTNALCFHAPGSNEEGICGFHHSGKTDFYIPGIPTYLPIIIRHTEDYFVTDESFIQFNGVDLFQYFEFVNPSFFDLQIAESEVEFMGINYYKLNINTLVESFFEKGNLIAQDENTPPCDSACTFACIDQPDRFVFLDSITVHRSNPLSLEYEFVSLFRKNSMTVLNDNVINYNRVLYAPVDSRNSSYLTGSHRLSLLYDFDTELSLTVENEFLPRISAHINVMKSNSLDMPNLIIAEDFGDDEPFRFELYPIRMDYETKQVAFDGKEVSLNFHRLEYGIWYGMYCVGKENYLGSNALAYVWGY